MYLNNAYMFIYTVHKIFIVVTNLAFLISFLQKNSKGKFHIGI